MTAPPVDDYYMCHGQRLQHSPEMDGDSCSESPKSPNTDVDQDYEAQPEATLQQTSIPSTDESFKGSTEQGFYIIITICCGRTTSTRIWLTRDPNNSRWVLEELATQSLSIEIAGVFNFMLSYFDAKLCPRLECGYGSYKYERPRLSTN